jgi:hypothetical protein
MDQQVNIIAQQKQGNKEIDQQGSGKEVITSSRGKKNHY